MLTKIRNRIVDCFSSLEKALKSIVFCLIPVMVFFLIMSDRTPYNYFAFIIYGLETIAILFYVIKFHKFVFDLFTQLIIILLATILSSQIINFSLLSFPRTILLLSAFSIVFYQFLITLSSKEKEFVFKLIIFGGLLFVAFFVLYYRKELIHLDFGNRLGREFSDQNDLAKNIAIFGIISEVLIFRTKTKRNIFYILCAILFLILVLITGSISNLLVLLLTTMFLLIYFTKGKYRVFAIIGIAVTVLLSVLMLQLPFMSYFKTRIDKMFNSLFTNSGNVDYSFIDRFNLAFYGIRLFSSKPLFGYGYDQVQYYTWGKNAFSHNNFIELLGSFGLFGFLAFEAILLLPIIKSWKKEGKEFTLFSLIYLFAFQLFLVIFRKKIEYFLIPLAFSQIDYSVHKGFSISIFKKKLCFKKFIEYGVGSSFDSQYSVDI